jgi:hypothetical protein
MSSLENRIERSVTRTAGEAIRELKVTFLPEYKWSIVMLTFAAISIGFRDGNILRVWSPG